MNKFLVKRISYYAPSKGYAVLLESEDGSRSLPIIVGSSEAQSIALYLENVTMPRPMTHDLFINFLDSMDSKVNRSSIVRIQNGTYFAEVEIELPNGEKVIVDSRPSDAISIALRSISPIFIADSVINTMNDKNYNEINDDDLEVNIPDKNISKGISQEMVIESLNDALDKAVIKEEYEVAARLRDRIKQLEENLNTK